jgi:hypothetical protein
MPTMPVSALYGMPPSSEEDARRGLAHLQHRFEAQAAAGAAKAKRAHAHGGALRELLPEVGKGSAELSALLRAQLHENKDAARRKTVVPQARKARAGLFPRAIGATLTPPYNWSWTWEAGNGGPEINTASADSANGTWSVSNWTSFDNSSNASSRAAVGIFFRPPTENGILQVWSSPALNYDWGDWCVFDGAGSDGWLGLYVGEYAVDGGGFVSAPVDQQINLWSDNSWWSGVGSQQGSNSGYPLSAQLQVDSDHFYEIWVWGGTDVYGAGWGTFSGSGAGGDLSARIPSITWELY